MTSNMTTETRLREAALNLGGLKELLIEAANEIERLTIGNQMLDGFAKNAENTVTTLQAELAALKAADARLHHYIDALEDKICGKL
jgi:uncharacterized protein (DUF1778 family)